jgi:hypothetical protein
MKKLSFIFVVSLLFSSNMIAQITRQQKENQQQQAIQQLVNAQQFTFIPQSVMPSHGPVKTLTADFQLKIKSDTLESYLPYFGRAYVASFGSTENPLDFKITGIKYSKINSKKGGWDITITPQNGGDARQLILSISKDGYASLQVISNNREPILFNGYIQ